MKITKFKITSEKIKHPTGCRIVHLSDLHKKSFGKNNIRLSEKIKGLSPDMIFITGDMISRSEKNLDSFQHFILSLLKIAPVYYSYGNHEKDIETINPKLYKKLNDFLIKNVILLDNIIYKIKIKDIEMNISGLTIFPECYKKNGSYQDLRKLSENDVTKLLKKNPDTSCLNILLAHNPMFFDAYAKYGSDIIFSGHVHGGCVRLPFIGGLLSPERKFFPKYTHGIYHKGKSIMIVSCGLGKFRLFNPPEIIVLDIN